MGCRWIMGLAGIAGRPGGGRADGGGIDGEGVGGAYRNGKPQDLKQQCHDGHNTPGQPAWASVVNPIMAYRVKHPAAHSLGNDRHRRQPGVK